MDIAPELSGALEELPVHHRQNLLEIRALTYVSVDKLVGYLTTINCTSQSGEVPEALYPHVFNHMSTIIHKLSCQGEYGVTKEVELFVRVMSRPESACSQSARNKKPKWLAFAHQKHFKWSEDTCVAAVEVGAIECLQYAHSNGCPWTERSCKEAAKRGHLNCLQYLHANNCPWGIPTCDEAARTKHLLCLRYLRENGCSWGSSTSLAAIKADAWHCLEYLIEENCPLPYEPLIAAVERGSVNCLRLFCRKGYLLNAYTFERAARCGHLGCMQYLHERNCPWNAGVCAAAAASGQLEALKFLHQKGAPWDSTTCAKAAGNGNLQCLKYATEQECPWLDSDKRKACQVAATGGNLELLKWSYESGGKWDRPKVINAAIKCGSLACLQYVRRNGGSFHSTHIELAFKNDALDCVKFMCEEDPEIYTHVVRYFAKYLKTLKTVAERMDAIVEQDAELKDVMEVLRGKRRRTQ